MPRAPKMTKVRASLPWKKDTTAALQRYTKADRQRFELVATLLDAFLPAARRLLAIDAAKRSAHRAQIEWSRLRRRDKKSAAWKTWVKKRRERSLGLRHHQRHLAVRRIRSSII